MPPPTCFEPRILLGRVPGGNKRPASALQCTASRSAGTPGSCVRPRDRLRSVLRCMTLPQPAHPCQGAPAERAPAHPMTTRGPLTPAPLQLLHPSPSSISWAEHILPGGVLSNDTLLFPSLAAMANSTLKTLPMPPKFAHCHCVARLP